MSNTLVEAHGLTRQFDVSSPWLNRLLQLESRRILTAVEDVSFKIERGKTFALVGESGSGKSTIAAMLVGLLRPCLLYTSPSPRDQRGSRMPSSA